MIGLLVVHFWDLYAARAALVALEEAKEIIADDGPGQ
jgi:hypothetical protein